MSTIEAILLNVLQQKFSLLPIKILTTDRIRRRTAKFTTEILVFNFSICVGGIGQYTGKYSADTINIFIGDIRMR